MTELKINRSMFLTPRELPPSAWTGHIPFAAWAMEELRPSVFVELGTHAGASYLAFCQAALQNGLATQCWAVDTWEGDEHAGMYDEDVFETLRAMHDERYGSFSKLLRMTFDEALVTLADGSVDLLHIDGLHTYEAVRHDFITWLPKISRCGVVLFHDIAVRERDFGVWKFWAEVSQRYPSFDFHHSHGLGVLVVGAQAPASLISLAALGEEARAPVRSLFETLAANLRQELDYEPVDEPAGEGMDPATAVAYLRTLLGAAHAQVADANRKVGRTEAQLKSQAAHAKQLMVEIQEREKRVELLNGQLVECRSELSKASDHLLAADQNARAHVAASALVQRDIQDLQRHIATQEEAVVRAQAERDLFSQELEAARAQLRSLDVDGSTVADATLENRRALKLAQVPEDADLARDSRRTQGQRVGELAQLLDDCIGRLDATTAKLANVMDSPGWRQVMQSSLLDGARGAADVDG